MTLFDYLTWVRELFGCVVFEDLSALCPFVTWEVPW